MEVRFDSGTVTLVAAAKFDGATMAQAARLKQEFGHSTALEDWKVFMAAYANVKALNEKLKDVSGEAKLWAEDKEFRARMLLQQLRGEPLLWLSQPENKNALEDDAVMIKALEGRYGQTKARVSYINQFEEAGQERGEDTRAFLSRLQQVASLAFRKLSDDSPRERVLSKFVRSVRDPRLREELQMFGFIDESSGDAKTYDEVLYKATRLGACWQAAGAQETNAPRAQPVQSDTVVEQLRWQIDELKGPVAAMRGEPSGVSSRQRNSHNWKCWYCGYTNHRGGWRDCPKRKREALGWNPKKVTRQNNNQGFR